MQPEFTPAKASARESPEPPVLNNIIKDDDILRQGKSVHLRVEDGWLIGFDSGEWGGTTYWSSNSGESCYQILPSFQVNNFFTRSDGIFATEGFANMGINQGGIIKIERNSEGVWRADKVLELPAKPRKILNVASDGTATIDLYWDSSVVKVRPDWTFTHTKPIKQHFMQWWVLLLVSLVISKLVKYLLE